MSRFIRNGNQSRKQTVHGYVTLYHFEFDFFVRFQVLKIIIIIIRIRFIKSKIKELITNLKDYYTKYFSKIKRLMSHNISNIL